jgi:PAS domain S-box-containing protein
VFNLAIQTTLILAVVIAISLVLVQARRLRHARAEAAAARAALQQMKVAYDEAPLGLTVLDRELRYVCINKMLAAINGLPVEAHLGKTIYEVVPEMAAAAAPCFLEVMRSGVPAHDLQFEGTTRADPSTVRTFRESVYPVRDGDGRIVGISVAAEDITERKRLLDALHASELRERQRATELESVMDATPAAVYIARDRACLNVTANAEATRLLRMRPHQNPSLSVPDKHGYEVYEDGVRLEPHQLPLQVAASSGNEVRDKELEARFDNGDRLYVLMHAVPLRAQDGEVIGSAAAFVDITAQKNAAQELQRQARHKDEFLAVLAHELRSPLAAVQSGLDLLQRGGADSARLDRTLAIMQRQMAHVVRLIDDLLDVARISSGKLELKTETVGVAEIVDAAIEFSRPDLERGRHHFQSRLPSGPLYVHADRVRLTEVISNLLHNAAKYTPDGGQIELAVEEAQGQAVFRVADNGVGIAPGSLPEMFKMFAQAEDAREQRRGGLGVGLALASRIVELHGGTISADSAGPGKGSIFTVRVPLVQVAAAASGAPAVGGCAACRILVLDDNVDAASTLGAMLEVSGHEVRLAHTGRAALDEMERFDADIAILDVGLPDMSGYDVARQIRERYPERGVLLVALTGWGTDSDRQQSERAGIDIHLTKPVTIAMIEQVILSRRAPVRSALASAH